MVVKKSRALSNSSRNLVLINYRKTLDEQDKRIPRSLLRILKKKSGREKHSGRITTRHQGGRAKRFYRIIDFKRYENDNIKGKVISINYDPNRTAFIGLISYENGKFSFIILPHGLKVGDEIISGENKDIPIRPGNNLPLSDIPVNTDIHCLELKPKKGAQLLRSAGAWGQIIGKEANNRYVLVKLGSKEVRRVLVNCRATIGKVSNSEHNLLHLGKAGRKRWMGIRPTVRGSAMNAVDHGHGGGKDCTPIGRRGGPVTPWGKKTLGLKTRKKKKSSSKYIVSSRHQSKK